MGPDTGPLSFRAIMGSGDRLEHLAPPEAHFSPRRAQLPICGKKTWPWPSHGPSLTDKQKTLLRLIGQLLEAAREVQRSAQKDRADNLRGLQRSPWMTV